LKDKSKDLINTDKNRFVDLFLTSELGTLHANNQRWVGPSENIRNLKKSEEQTLRAKNGYGRFS